MIIRVILVMTITTFMIGCEGGGVGKRENSPDSLMLKEFCSKINVRDFSLLRNYSSFSRTEKEEDGKPYYFFNKFIYVAYDTTFFLPCPTDDELWEYMSCEDKDTISFPMNIVRDGDGHRRHLLRLSKLEGKPLNVVGKEQIYNLNRIQEVLKNYEIWRFYSVDLNFVGVSFRRHDVLIPFNDNIDKIPNVKGDKMIVEYGHRNKHSSSFEMDTLSMPIHSSRALEDTLVEEYWKIGKVFALKKSYHKTKTYIVDDKRRWIHYDTSKVKLHF